MMAESLAGPMGWLLERGVGRLLLRLDALEEIGRRRAMVRQVGMSAAGSRLFAPNRLSFFPFNSTTVKATHRWYTLLPYGFWFVARSTEKRKTATKNGGN